MKINWYQKKFIDFKEAYDLRYNLDARKIRIPSTRGLVSIVLPAYNGADMIKESIDSVLRQDYSQWELICVNDGSTDETPSILDQYAMLDKRIKVLHQKNQKLPKALSNGFKLASGEFLTWTSCDNRMRSDFLSALISDIRNKGGNMIYSNLSIINQDGAPFVNSEWYKGYQTPCGSSEIYLPSQVSILNIWPNNFIGASFLYDRLAYLVAGDYSCSRFCLEDYDYWMKINETLELRHTCFSDSIYEYRFHDKSLTSQDKQLRITESRASLMVFDDFRRDKYLTPTSWVVDCDEKYSEFIDSLSVCLTKRGPLSDFWNDSIYVKIGSFDDFGEANVDSQRFSVFILADGAYKNPTSKGEWDLLIAISEDENKGWVSCADLKTAFSLIEVVAKTRKCDWVEGGAARAHSLDASIVICTHKRSEQFERAINYALNQDYKADRYEVVVVNNHPSDLTIRDICQKACIGRGNVVTFVDCHAPGLSNARNAGIAAARGNVVMFMDDDAYPKENWISETLRLFNLDSSVGVIGGQILLGERGFCKSEVSGFSKSYWSHLQFNQDQPFNVSSWWEFPWGANWSAKRELLFKIGGFRANYGRNGNDFGGGEEVVAAAQIASLGFKVLINPRSIVIHDVDSSRFTKRHVYNTIRSGELVHYRLQRDLIIGMELSYKQCWHDVWSSFKKLIVFAVCGKKNDALESCARLDGRLRVFYCFIRDNLNWKLDF